MSPLYACYYAGNYFSHTKLQNELPLICSHWELLRFPNLFFRQTVSWINTVNFVFILVISLYLKIIQRSGGTKTPVFVFDLLMLLLRLLWLFLLFLDSLLHHRFVQSLFLITSFLINWYLMYLILFFCFILDCFSIIFC